MCQSPCKNSNLNAIYTKIFFKNKILSTLSFLILRKSFTSIVISFFSGKIIVKNNVFSTYDSVLMWPWSYTINTWMVINYKWQNFNANVLQSLHETTFVITTIGCKSQRHIHNFLIFENLKHAYKIWSEELYFPIWFFKIKHMMHITKKCFLNLCKCFVTCYSCRKQKF